jgi:phosphonopyruvate decarboxylase
LAKPDLPLAGRYSADSAPAWSKNLLEAFREDGIRHLVYVPDQMLGGIFALAEADPDFRLTPVHREEEAVGVACGMYLAGQRAAVVIQSSGLGNCLNALGSLAIASRIPFPLVVGLRGELGEFNPAQFAMGRGVPGCLSAVGIQHFTVEDPDRMGRVASGALMSCWASSQPVGILISAQLTGWKEAAARMIDRLEATRIAVELAGNEPIISSIGNPGSDLSAYDRPENFYVWAMGMAPSLALGVAVARPDRRVIVLDGDGALLMNLGSLASARMAGVRNIVHVVWDNACWEITGGQPTGSAYGVDLAGMAAAAGFRAASVDELEAFRSAFAEALKADDSTVIVARVAPGNSKRSTPLASERMRDRFMATFSAAG